MHQLNSFKSDMERQRQRLFLITGILILMCYVVVGVPHPPTTTEATLTAQRFVRQAAYDSKFDNVDLDEILRQDRLLNNYIKCLEGQGPCTPDAKMLKEILPDAVTTDCVKCTEKQKYGAEKVTRHLIDNRPKDWERLEKIYDPLGSYRIKYLAMKQQQQQKESQPQTTTTTEPKQNNDKPETEPEPEPESQPADGEATEA